MPISSPREVNEQAKVPLASLPQSLSPLARATPGAQVAKEIARSEDLPSVSTNQYQQSRTVLPAPASQELSGRSEEAKGQSSQVSSDSSFQHPMSPDLVSNDGHTSLPGGNARQAVAHPAEKSLPSSVPATVRHSSAPAPVSVEAPGLALVERQESEPDQATPTFVVSVRAAPPGSDRPATNATTGENASDTAVSTIQVSIGRVVVRAALQPPAAPKRASRPVPALALSEYLKQRKGETR